MPSAGRRPVWPMEDVRQGDAGTPVDLMSIPHLIPEIRVGELARLSVQAHRNARIQEFLQRHWYDVELMVAPVEVSNTGSDLL